MTMLFGKNIKYFNNRNGNEEALYSRMRRDAR